MPENNFSSVPDTPIKQDKMRLSVMNLHPFYKEESMQENRRKISARLCRIFQKYNTGNPPEADTKCITHYMQGSQSKKKIVYP